VSASADLRGYAICTEPRSGSTYLTRLLVSTGVLGLPREFFNPRGKLPKETSGYGPDRMIEAVLTYGRTDNGVYGVKVFTDTFANPAQDWCKVLPNLSFIHFEREDLLGQAISWTRAVQTGVYVSTDAPSGEAFYDAAAIGYFLLEGARRQARWRLFFARNGLAPLRLSYEGLVADPAGAVAAIAALVDAPQARIDPGRVGLEVQRDALSQDWRERYLAEMGDLSRLDRADRGSGQAFGRLVGRARARLRRRSRRA
jgi:LPS sulfotransferase NodH